MSEKEFNYDEHPIDRVYVSWANTLDSTGEDSSRARIRITEAEQMMKAVKCMMLEVIDTGKVVDQVKKSIFYDKPVPEDLIFDLIHCSKLTDLEGVKSRWDDHELIRLFHAVIGIAGEAAEMMEALYAYIYMGQEISMTNIIEETGDSLWYHALIAKWAKFNTLDEFMASNKAKLTKRYGTKWNQEGALNRDTEAEMEALKQTIAIAHYHHPACAWKLCPNRELCEPTQGCVNKKEDAAKIIGDIDEQATRLG